MKSFIEALFGVPEPKKVRMTEELKKEKGDE